MSRPVFALPLLLLLALSALGSLVYGGRQALLKSDDLLRRAEEISLFVGHRDPYTDPDATYPPPAYPILTPLIAPFSEEALKAVWLGLNLVAALGVGAAIVHLWGRDWPTWLKVAAVLVVLASKPTRLSIGMGQFSLLPTALLLGALIALDRGRDLLAGLCVGLALAKPTMAIPFVFVLLVLGRWRALLFRNRRSGCRPRPLLGLAAGLADPPDPGMARPGPAATIGRPGGRPLVAGEVRDRGPLGGVASLFVADRDRPCGCSSARPKRPAETLGAFALIGAALFTYHRPYDLVLLLPAAAIVAGSGRPATASGGLSSLVTTARPDPAQPSGPWSAVMR